MTKKTITILLIFHVLTAMGQIIVSPTKFKHTSFKFDGKISEIKEISIQVDTILDLNFYRTYFNKPYLFPNQFINKKFKNETIETWHDSTREMNIKTNWYFSYTYDSLSRVTDYAYSGCLICNIQFFCIQITYDKQNRPVYFQTRHTFDNNKPASEEYYFSYDINGNIIQIRFIMDGKIHDQIDRL